MPTDQPSGSSQMLRMDLPSTRIALCFNGLKRFRKQLRLCGGRQLASANDMSQIHAAVFIRNLPRKGSGGVLGRDRLRSRI
jgi:hypothetical protein